MKKINLIFIAAEIFCAIGMFAGCVSNRNFKTLSTDYETAEFVEYSELYEIEAVYPVFADESLSVLNQEIESFVLNCCERIKQAALEDEEEIRYWGPKGRPYFFDIGFSVFYGKNCVTVLFDAYEYTGGAHGNYNYKSFCYNTETFCAMDIEEATGLTLDVIADETRQYFIENEGYSKDDSWFMSGTEGEPGCYQTFGISEDTLLIYFAPYCIDSYAAGTKVATISLE